MSVRRGRRGLLAATVLERKHAGPEAEALISRTALLRGCMNPKLNAESRRARSGVELEDEGWGLTSLPAKLAIRLAPLRFGYQEVAPSGQALPGLGGGFKDPCAGGGFAEVGQRGGVVVIARLGQVQFADDGDIRRLEHGRIFERLVFAFRHGQEHDAQVFAEVVGGGADEIPDVLDDEQVQARQIELLERAGYHLGFEMADGAGGDLHDRRAGFAQAAGVVVSGQVADDDGCFQASSERADSFAEEGGFARTGRRQDVQHQETVRLEHAAVAFGLTVVLIEDGPSDFDLAARWRRRRWRFVSVARLAGRMEMRVRVRMVVVVVVPVSVVMGMAVTRPVLMPVVGG